MVQVKFGNSQLNNGFVPTVTAQEPLTLEWNLSPGSLYTVIMYDLDEPQVHLFVINVKGDDVANGTHLVDYKQPNPSFPHTYNVDVYSQSGTIINNFIRDINSFISSNGLKLIDRTTFKIGSKILTAKSKQPSKKYNETEADKANYFHVGTTLTDQQQKWCRCVLKVADKQAGACNIEHAWFQQRDGHSCYNPYAVCSKSVGTSVRTCGENYNFEALSDDHLLAYAQLHQKTKNVITIPTPYKRSQMLENIRKWKASENK